MKQFLLYSLLLLTLSMGMAACGIKPGSVDAPPGVEDNIFPNTYPDPTTDPVPDNR